MTQNPLFMGVYRHLPLGNRTQIPLPNRDPNDPTKRPKKITRQSCKGSLDKGNARAYVPSIGKRGTNMQTTFILKNIAPAALDAVMSEPAAQIHAKLTKWAFGDLRHCVTVKYGSGAFRDRVEWNQIMRDVAAGVKELTATRQPRKGYTLVTFLA
jgi:hypothetical protein